MIRHVVLMKWKPGVTESEVNAIEEGLGRMPDVMPFIRRYEMGRDLAITGTHDFALVADFDTVDDYLTYADNADHKQVIVDLVGPAMESMARVQYTL